jgi:hypothetical protein
VGGGLCFNKKACSCLAAGGLQRSHGRSLCTSLLPAHTHLRRPAFNDANGYLIITSTQPPSAFPPTRLHLVPTPPPPPSPRTCRPTCMPRCRTPS